MGGKYQTFLALVLIVGTAACKKGVESGSPGSPNNHTLCRSLGLEGRLAIVTGGASGIGRAVSKVLAREGATVIVADRNRTGSNETIHMLQASYPGDHRAIYVDVANSTAVGILFKEIKSSFPGRKLSVVVNSAGIAGSQAPIEETNDTAYDEVVDIDLKGTFLIDRASVKSMLANNVKDGAIVNIASITAKPGNPELHPYSAAKGGVVTLSKAVAREVAGRGIRVNTILPGPVDTPLLARFPADFIAKLIEETSLKRLARPEEIAEVIAFMCSPKSSYMVGAAIDVTGGIATG